MTQTPSMIALAALRHLVPSTAPRYAPAWYTVQTLSMQRAMERIASLGKRYDPLEALIAARLVTSRMQTGALDGDPLAGWV